jgi:hypothetical protein
MQILRSTLIDKIASIELELTRAIEALEVFDALPENNTFEDYDKACASIEGTLEHRARSDCEGSYNYGNDEYTQEFIVNGKHYLGKLEVEYNRHDKTYYYVDQTKFTVTEIN